MKGRNFKMATQIPLGYFSIWMWIVYCTLSVNMKIQVNDNDLIKTDSKQEKHVK